MNVVEPVDLEEIRDNLDVSIGYDSCKLQLKGQTNAGLNLVYNEIDQESVNLDFSLRRYTHSTSMDF